MSRPCPDCGAACTYVRARHDFIHLEGRLLAEEVPSLRCESCGRTDVAHHARPVIEAVMSVVEDVPGTARKDFSSTPLRPKDPPSSPAV